MSKSVKSPHAKDSVPTLKYGTRSLVEKLDDLDFHILWHLDYEARASITSIGEKVGLSKQSLRYRIERLKDLGVIKNSFAVIDIHRLGLLTYRVYYRFAGVDLNLEAQIIKQFVDSAHTLWVVVTEGNWDMQVVFVARNFIHFNQIFKEMQYKISNYVRRFNISSSPVCYQFRRDYLLLDKRQEFSATYHGFEPSGVEYDEVDFGILSALSVDAQQSNEDIATQVGISNTAVARRIQSLEKDKVIRVYRQPVDLEILGRNYVKALLSLSNLSAKIEKEIYDFCSKKSFVVYLTEVVGQWQLEIESEVINAKELTNLMKELSTRFPSQIQDYQLLHIEKQHKLNFLPTGNATKNVLLKTKQRAEPY